MKTVNVQERDIRLQAAMRNLITRTAKLKHQPDSIRALVADEVIEVCDAIVKAPVRDWELSLEEIETSIQSL